MAKPLIVLGSVNADLYVEIPRLPQPGETLPGTGAAVRPGGKGANQAAAAARLGGSVRFAGRIGRDPFAAPLRQALAGAGVELGLLQEVDGPTGQALILLQRGGENSIVLVAGANHAWDGLDRSLAEALPGAGCLLLQREVPEAVNLLAASAAHAAGVPVVLDAGGADAPLAPELLRRLAVLSPNETELARLTGLPTGSDAQVLAAARALQAQGVGTVLVKLGARGCLLVPREGEPLPQPSFRVPVVDTTGAGDCFTGAWTLAMMEGQEARARLRFACAAAALCVQGLGALPSMPTRAAVEAFLKDHP